MKYWDNKHNVYCAVTLFNNPEGKDPTMQIEYGLAEVAPPVVMEETLERPASVVESFVRLVEAGEIELAIRFLSKEIVSRIGFEKLESIFLESSSVIWSAGGIEIVDVQTIAFSRDHAEMRLSIWYGDHKVESEVVELVREGGRWKIVMEEVGMAVSC
jgi:hypothetical protein